MSDKWKVPIAGKYYGSRQQVVFFRVEPATIEAFENELATELEKVEAAKAGFVFLVNQIMRAIENNQLEYESGMNIIGAAIQVTQEQGWDVTTATITRTAPLSPETEVSAFAKYLRG